MREVFVPTEQQKVSRIEEIVTAYPEVAGLQAYEYLRSPDIEAQKAEFIDGSRTELDITYPDLNQATIDRLAGPSQAALTGLLPGERTVKTDALFDAIEYRQSELFMLVMATEMHDGTKTPAERQKAQDWFKLAVENLYGVPKADIFNALAHKHFAEAFFAGRKSPAHGQIVDELSGLLGSFDATEYRLFTPDEELIKRIGGLVRERFSYALDHIELDREYDPPAMRDAFQTMLDKLGGTQLGWLAALAAHSAALSTAPHKKLLEIGEDRDPLMGDELQAKGLHEGMVHAGRSITAERAGYLSAAYGQDGYLDFEEGLATALSDAFEGKFTNYGVDYYLLAGLAYGLDNHEPRDFQQVFDIMWRYKFLTLEKPKDILETDIEKAKSLAYTRCMRFFRGTDGRTPGLIFTKDLAYFGGQISAWSVLKDVHAQADLDPLLAGKLDNTKPDHQHLAQLILRDLSEA